MSTIDWPGTPPSSPRSLLLPSLTLVLWLALAQPEQADALHPPPAFVAGADNPFGLADVGAESSPSVRRFCVTGQSDWVPRSKPCKP